MEEGPVISDNIRRRAGCGKRSLPIMFLSLAIVFTLILTIPVEPSEGFERVKSTVAYDSLTDDQKRAYDEIAVVTRNLSDVEDLSYLTVEEGHLVYDAFIADNPEIFWFRECYELYKYGDGRCSSLHYNGALSYDQIIEMQTQLYSSYSSLKFGANDSDYQKIKIIHDWICDHMVYAPYAKYANNLYGAMVNGRCVCEGYSLAFSFLCHLAGYQCIMLTGTVQSSMAKHAWNIVQCDNAWYFVDTTWDDNDYTPHKYFMLGSNTKKDGRPFATEDHIADRMYGVTASENEHPGNMIIQKNYSLPVIGAAVVFVILICVANWYRSRRIASEENRPRCQECGKELEPEWIYCPICSHETGKK